VLAKLYPNSTFTGLDYSERGIDLANLTKTEKGLTNVNFVMGDGQNLPEEWKTQFDMVFVYDVIHDVPNPFKCLEQIYKVLKDEGCFCLVDVGFHSDPLDNAGDIRASMYYTLSTFICLTSSMTEEPHVGYGAMWGVEELEKALKSTNFKIEGTGAISLIGTKVFFYCTK